MAVFGGPHIIEDGLVLHLDAANPKSYPGSGNTWYDLSSSKYNFTLLNGPIVSNGAMVFDGTNQCAKYTSFPLQMVNTDFTIRILFYTDSSNNLDGMILNGNGPFNSGGNGMEIRKRFGYRLEFSVADGIGSGIRTFADTTSYVGRWTDICFSFLKATESKYYINGMFGATTSYAGETTLTTTYDFLIGKGHDTYFPGKISMVSLYNRALSADEITQNFNAIRSRYTL